ncbi:hypothetical protein [Gloeocapsopsis sp. IPPAS B-1203]|nr:hypothetical protein [Gloeocapsopsis sp. IPPAS B-1203]
MSGKSNKVVFLLAHAMSHNNDQLRNILLAARSLQSTTPHQPQRSE